MVFINQNIIYFLKKIKLYNFCKYVYKKYFENIFNLELEKNENYIISKYVKKGKGIIIDIGAHKGDKTKVFLKFFPKDEYYLFEPFENYYQILIKKFNKKKNINILKKAASSENKKQNFYYSENPKNSESFSLNTGSHLEKKTTTDVISLDSFFVNKNDIKLIKIDAEGLEPQIIEGGRKIIQKYSPILLMETNHITHFKLENLLNKLNMNLYIYEYYIFENENLDYRTLGDITKLNDKTYLQNNINDKKFYKFKNFDQDLQFLTNSFAINKIVNIEYINFDFKII